MTKTRKTIIIFALLIASIFMFFHEKAKFHPAQQQTEFSSQQNAINKSSAGILSNGFKEENSQQAEHVPTEEEAKHKMFLERSAEIQRQAQRQAQELQEKTKNNPQEMLHQIVTGFM